jgi:hypothetical protein
MLGSVAEYHIIVHIIILMLYHQSPNFCISLPFFLQNVGLGISQPRKKTSWSLISSTDLFVLDISKNSKKEKIQVGLFGI